MEGQQSIRFKRELKAFLSAVNKELNMVFSVDLQSFWDNWSREAAPLESGIEKYRSENWYNMEPSIVNCSSRFRFWVL